MICFSWGEIVIFCLGLIMLISVGIANYLQLKRDKKERNND